jgi:hypothetical protein
MMISNRPFKKRVGQPFVFYSSLRLVTEHNDSRMNNIVTRRTDALENCPFHGKPVSLFSEKTARFYCTSCPYTDMNAIRFYWHSYRPIVPYQTFVHRGVQCVTRDKKTYAYLFRTNHSTDGDDDFESIDCNARQCITCGCPMDHPTFPSFQFCSIECKYAPYVHIPRESIIL